MLTQSSAVPLSTRSAALLEVATELGSRAGAARDARQRSALLGLHCLAAFASKQFTLFEKGFANGSLALDSRFPPAFVLEATARQVTHDIDVFLRTIGQRDAEASTAAMRSALGQADRLAAAALSPAVQRKLIEETAVLTYFQKTPTVRLLPYTPLALVGIDLSAIRDTSRLLAIAHEVGHHVYRQLTTNYTTHLDEQVAERMDALAPERAAAPAPAWLLAWAEEVFADVYSVLVAGPVAGLSMQSVLMTESPEVLLQDDADHPLPALRPEIAVFVLQKLAALDRSAAARLQSTAERLSQQWRAYLAEKGTGPAFTPAGGGAPVSLETGRTELRRHVDALLSGQLAGLAADGKARWSKGLSEPAASLSSLYAQFTATCDQLAGSVVPELTLEAGKRVVVTPQVAGVTGGQRVVGQIGDPYLDGLRDDALAGKRKLSAGAWKAVFLAGDWVTESGGSGITPIR